MRLHTNRCLLCSFVFLACIVLLLTVLYSTFGPPTNFTPFRRSENLLNNSRYEVDTPACKIPNLNPLDKSILPYIAYSKVVCNESRSMTFVDGQFLRLNRTNIASELGSQFSHCRYQNITRDRPDDTAFKYGKLGGNFSEDVLVEDDFIRVLCYNHSGGVVHVSFHALVLAKAALEFRCEERHKGHLRQYRPREVLNLIMVGLDSMSRSNVIRQMPQTRRFLLDELGAVEMMGYNKVGENTFPNAVPMLGGRHVEELPFNRSMAKTTTFEKFPFLWHLFSWAGYRTLYAEDDTWSSTFSFMKRGFLYPPTDYYLRPLIQAMNKYEDHRVLVEHCVHDMQLTEFVLQYPTAFFRLFRDKPFFALTFIEKLTHDFVNNAGSADHIYLSYLKALQSEGVLNKTVLVFFSDHGRRFGDVASTSIGRAEDRLPYMSLAFPAWFPKRYPELIKNLRQNSARLTTAFDVHETLKDVLYFDGQVRMASLQQRGISLLRAVPESRNCSHAGVPPHWCMCLSSRPVSATSALALQAGREVVRSINLLLEPSRDVCANLSLKVVHRAEKVIANGHFIENTRKGAVVYQLMIETQPGNGRFEATVKYNAKADKFAMVGESSRIDRYGHLKKCVADFVLERYCYCKEFV